MIWQKTRMTPGLIFQFSTSDDLDTRHRPPAVKGRILEEVTELAETHG
jgi:hypothetical protein